MRTFIVYTTLYAKGALLNRLVVAVQRSSLCTLMFLEQKRDDDIEVCRDDLLLMRRLLRDIEKEKINHMKQGQLNWFVDQLRNRVVIIINLLSFIAQIMWLRDFLHV